MSVCNGPAQGESVGAPFLEFSALEGPYSFFFPPLQKKKKKAAFSGNFTTARFSCLPSLGWEREEDLYLLFGAGQGAP